MTSNRKRAPPPRSHRDRWAKDELHNQAELPPTSDAVQQALIHLLRDISGYYNRPGYPPPTTPEVELLRLQDILHGRLQELDSKNSVSHIAHTVASALLHPVTVPWDADRFAERAKDTRENDDYISPSNLSLSKFFNMVELGSFSDPLVILDCHGRILIWYLPGLVYNIEELNEATTYLNNQLASSIPIPKEGKTIPWRLDPNSFLWRTGETRYEPGCLDFSPSWFQANKERLVDDMCHSVSLRKQPVSAWLKGIANVESDLNFLLCLIAPELYNAGRNAINQLKNREDVHKNVTAWPSVFSGMSVICDRKTQMHRDQGGWPACYDLLVAGGAYDEAWLEVPDIGAKFMYQPGTAVAICGKVLRHSVNHSIGGQRLCYAHYMRNNVHNRLHIPQTSWVSFKSYTAYMSSSFLARQTSWHSVL